MMSGYHAATRHPKGKLEGCEQNEESRCCEKQPESDDKQPDANEKAGDCNKPHATLAEGLAYGHNPSPEPGDCIFDPDNNASLQL
jgi:hypothetical protein